MSDESKAGAPAPSEDGSGFPLGTHLIRLRGAWETTRDAGVTTHRRNFGRPRTLDPGERIWLVCAHVPGPGEVTINGGKLDILPAAGPFSADITDRLLARNAVAFAVASDGPLGDVALEVRRVS